MKMRFLTVATLCLSMVACNNVEPNAKPDVEYDLYLLIGQSNMEGEAPLNDCDTVDGVWLLDSKGEIVPASNPINRYSTIRYQGTSKYGLGGAFGKAVVMSTARKVLLVSNARGGSAIAEWQKGSAYNFYDEAVRRTCQAMNIEGVALRGILWHQGEADSDHPYLEEYYFSKLTDLVNDLRGDFGMPELPFIAGEIADAYPTSAEFNSVIDKIADYIPFSSAVDSEGCTVQSDNTHFTRDGYDLLGRRYAEKAIEMCYPKTTAE